MSRAVSNFARRPVGRGQVELLWLATVRWAGLLADVGVIVAGLRGLTDVPLLWLPAALIGAAALSNIWLAWRVRQEPMPSSAVAGACVVADVVVLSALLREFGGVLNPVGIFYLVDIVLAALVLGRAWTWVVTLLSIGGYGVLFLAPSSSLTAAQTMHPEIGMHIQGMWLAFAATALIVALLVARLASMVERRDRALGELHERSARDARLAGLATLAAGAAHELSTPLATIAVAAKELELGLRAGTPSTDALDDVTLIRTEIARCRQVLDNMAANVGEPAGGAPVSTTVAAVIDRALASLPTADRSRLDVDGHAAISVIWPIGVMTQALVNLIRNGLQASAPAGRVTITTRQTDQGVEIEVRDTGGGMSRETLARAGEPFFTTKTQGSGMGLGLFVAKSAVDRLGGELTLRSEERVGTFATVRLPVAAVSRSAS